MKSSNIAVDLDGVILNFNWNSWSSRDMDYFGVPIKGSINGLKRLRKLGYRIIIHTCRTNPVLNNGYTLEKLYEKVKRILKKHKIPHDEIWLGAGKPIADFYIDDRAIKFESWRQVIQDIKKEANGDKSE